jgi:hypothetical protein
MKGVERGRREREERERDNQTKFSERMGTHRLLSPMAYGLPNDLSASSSRSPYSKSCYDYLFKDRKYFCVKEKFQVRIDTEQLKKISTKMRKELKYKELLAGNGYVLQSRISKACSSEKHNPPSHTHSHHSPPPHSPSVV